MAFPLMTVPHCLELPPPYNSNQLSFLGVSVLKSSLNMSGKGCEGIQAGPVKPGSHLLTRERVSKH